MSTSIVSQIPGNLLFRYRIECPYLDATWNAKLELPKTASIPCFGREQANQIADVRLAWNETGLFVWCKSMGKRQSVWCRSTQILESDGLQLWIDTRDTHNIHRASKFCHWIALLPAGGQQKLSPLATMLKINRAKEDSPSINQVPIKIASDIKKTGYSISAFIPATCLNGWNPSEHASIGFSYAIVDRELGWQTLSTGPEFPISEDPSLWSTLMLLPRKTGR